MAKTQAQQTATSLAVCASCKREVGVEAKRLPFNVDDHATAGEKAHYEAFCPQCFVYVRSPREPQRWPPGFFIPVKCLGPRCDGLESVTTSCNDNGKPVCPNCQGSRTLVLPPKLGAS